MNTLKVLAFDIETKGLGGDAVFLSWCDGGEPQGTIVNQKGFPDFTVFFIKHFLIEKYRGYVIVAHNGLRFDYARLDWLAIANAGYEGRFYTAKDYMIRGVDLSKNKRTWKLRDSLTYCGPGFNSLADFAHMFAKNLVKGKIDFDNEDFDVWKPEHVEYALNDAAVLHEACCGYDSMLRERFNVSIMKNVTASGLSFRAMKKQAKEDGYGELPYCSQDHERAIRSSYHGGFTAAFRIGTFKNLVYYDINSAYAWAMETYNMPGSGGNSSFTRLPGINLCLASVDFRDSFPYLISKPYLNRVSGRYAGKIIGWFWDFELDLQRQLGAQVLEHYYINWNYEDSRLKHFIQKCKALRMEDYHGALGNLAKLMQNSVYGKCGSEPHLEDMILASDLPDEAEPAYDSRGEPIPGLWLREAERKSLGSLVHWASYITARVRWRLMNYLMLIPREDWIYSDTDSFMVPEKYRDRFSAYIGNNYGQIKLEGEIDSITIRAPKTYNGITKDGKVKIANKGIPGRKSKEAWEKEIAYFESMRSLRFTIAGKLRGERVKSYTYQTHRALTRAANMVCGYYDAAGYWQPKAVSATLDTSEHCVAMRIPEIVRKEFSK